MSELNWSGQYPHDVPWWIRCRVYFIGVPQENLEENSMTPEQEREIAENILRAHDIMQRSIPSLQEAFTAIAQMAGAMNSVGVVATKDEEPPTPSPEELGLDTEKLRELRDAFDEKERYARLGLNLNYLRYAKWMTEHGYFHES